MATKITDRVTIHAQGKEVIFDGCDFTGNGYIVVNEASRLVIRNCRIYNHEAEGAKSYWLRINGDIPCEVIIENCFFGYNPYMYNILEMNAKLKTGSSFSNNYFAEGSCTHNYINLYGCADNAQIQIDGNVMEVCSSAIRIGMKGNPKCAITLADNVTLKAEEGKWGGVALIQPYGKQTISFADVEIFIDNLVYDAPQKIYAYSGANDTPMTDETVPTVYMDGKKIHLPILH